MESQFSGHNEQALTQRTKVYIDQYALSANYAVVRSLAPLANILAMVKGNGYGHGLINTAQALPDADGFGVATLQEAQLLRQHGFKQKIVLMSGIYNREELEYCLRADIDLVIHDYYQIDLLRQYHAQSVIAWIKVDTGMHRLGFTAEEVDGVYQELNALPCVRKPIHLMTHFPSADDDAAMTTAQIQTFNSLNERYGAPCSMANSAAVLDWPQSHGQWVRTGGLLYGLSPKVGQHGQQINLKPAMRVSSELITIKQLKAGQTVGYHRLWQAPESMPIGIIGCGYGDGYPWHAPSGTPVWIKGAYCQIIGAVSMDFIAVDLRPVKTPRVGDDAVLWGPENPVERVAEYIGVNPYSLISAMGPRTPSKIVQNHWDKVSDDV